MTCKICGQTLPEGSNVCKYCGAHVRAGASPEKKPARRYSKKGLARKRLINLIIALLALLMICAVVIGVIWSAQQAGQKGNGDLQMEQDAQQDEESEDPEDAEEPQDSEKPEDTEQDAPAQRPEGSIIQQRPQENQPEADTPEEEDEPADTDTPAQPGQTGTQPQNPTQPQQPSGKYTISINRTETTASLNHYRELYVYINETLPEGVEIVETTWTSSNPNVVRTEPGKAWGVSVGTATVTGTIKLSDGQTLSATCTVNVVESQTGTGTTTVSGDYVLPDSSTRLITAAELDSLSAYQLWIARNEIYARHGRKFTNTDLANYFAGKSWYKGTIAAASFDESLLSSIERQNVDAILAEEATR